MSREIKFRAWDTNRKKMHTPEQMGIDQMTILPNGQGFINVHGRDTKLSELYPHLIPLQYTGLKDRNGKEIYEGDVVRHFGLHGEEDWKGAIFFWEGAFVHRATANDALVNYNCPAYCEVMGNIYEDPELLKETS